MVPIKVICTLIALVFLVRNSNAQLNDNVLLSDTVNPATLASDTFIATEEDCADEMLTAEEKQFYIKKFQKMEEKGRHLRKGGAIMIGGGVCSMLGCAIILAVSGKDPTDDNTNGTIVLPIALGTTAFICGGTGMIIKGTKLVHRGITKQKELNIALSLKMTGIELSFNY